jgi:hypothetical protein
MKSPSRVFGLKDPIVLTGQQVPIGATHPAPAGTVGPRLRALDAVYKVLLGEWLHDAAAFENVPNQHGSLNSLVEVHE